MKTTTSKKMKITLVLLAFVMMANATTINRYVTLNGAGDFSGSTWENAAVGTAVGIQAQIDAVSANTDRGEVRFGAGTYALSATLTLKDGASLIGGYPTIPVTGTNETRNWVTNQTIFDGGDARKLLNAPDGAGILYSHITTIDGLIIQRGRASYGSAVAICYGFVMQNCIIRNNTYSSTSSDLGGAIRIYRNSFGGGATAPAANGTPNALNCGAALINCLIVNNTTTKGPAAINVDGYSSSSIINCVIANNLTTDTRLTKIRNTNNRGYYPGGILIGSYAHGSRVVNNIFYNNSNNGQKDCDKHLGSGFYAGALFNNYFDGDQAFKDSVAVYYERPTSTATAYYKNFNSQNNKCNVDYAASTIFAAPNAILGSSAVQADIDAIYASDWRLKAGSKAINAGISNASADLSYPYIYINSANRAYSTITTDFEGGLRVAGGTPDLGAYESNFTVTVTTVAGSNGSVSAPVVVSLGSPVTVEATANSGYAFVAWNDGTNNVSTSSSYTFTPTTDVTLTASFSISTGLNKLLDKGLIVRGRSIEIQKAANSVSIYNAVGATIVTQNNVGAGTTITLNNSGVYLVKVQSNQGVVTQKIVVQ